MKRVVPLIRAAAFTPCIRWMETNGRDPQKWLRAAGLGPIAFADPLRPIPLRVAGNLMRDLARAEGPDIACRVVAANSIRDLARLGEVALGARTPREALTRVASVLHFHCTHEYIAINAPKGDMEVCEHWSFVFDDETLHTIHQYFTSMIRVLCSLTQAPEPFFSRVEIVPHPVFGLEYLRPRFGDVLAPARLKTLRLVIDRRVADHPFVSTARNRGTKPAPSDWRSLRGDEGLAGSMKLVIAAMLGSEDISIAAVAVAVGMSRRTLQRRLAYEGASFSKLVEDTRREEALRAISEGSVSLGEIAANLGYANQSTLTRAVRRWTGSSPRQVAKSARSRVQS